MVQSFKSKWQRTLSSTAYLTSNAWAKRVIEEELRPGGEHSSHPDIARLRRFGNWDIIRADELGRLEHIWEYVSEEDSIHNLHSSPIELIAGGTLPRYVTDRGVAVGRNHDFDRMILHYTQPHYPYLSNAISEERVPSTLETEPFEYIRETGDRESVWNAYLDDLRWVLDDVELLLRNLDAETVVISADHGESFGEYGVFGHHAGSVHPKIRRVPWAITTANDESTYSSTIEPQRQSRSSVDDQLEALGYKL